MLKHFLQNTRSVFTVCPIILNSCFYYEFFALDCPSPELPEKACAITATLHQEKERFDNLLKIVHSSLKSLVGALRGEILINKSLEEISHSIMRNKVPKEWLVRKSHCQFGKFS